MAEQHHQHHHDLNEQFEEVFSGKRSDEEIIAHQRSHAHHHHDPEHPHVHGDTKDYMSAVNEYRKTFPNKQQQIEQTPDPAVREMLLHLQDMGIETGCLTALTVSSHSVTSVLQAPVARTASWVHAG